jgi:hypothetical protein
MPSGMLIAQAIRNGAAQALAAPVVPQLVHYIIGFGSGSATLRSPNTVEMSGNDPYQTTRNGITFGVASGASADGGGGIVGSGADARFITRSAMGTSVYRILLPDGTYTFRAAMGTNFATVPLGIRIFNFSNSAVLHSASANATSGQAIDITGAVRTVGAWDATNAAVSGLVVSGGQGISIDRNAQNSVQLNYMEITQTA